MAGVNEIMTQGPGSPPSPKVERTAPPMSTYGEESDDRGHEPAMPNEDARIDRHARIRP
jgi:hypothetical protein